MKTFADGFLMVGYTAAIVAAVIILANLFEVII